MKDFDYDVIIAGGGPAGASAAIHLAARGASVLLAEQKKFPRPKLCGEFISPECITHFEKLGVADRMFAAGPASLTETVFYSRSGKSVRVPSSWFSTGGAALGLSRAEMDERLLRRAADCGVRVLEDSPVTSLLYDGEGDERVSGVTVKNDGRESHYRAQVVLDATGRGRSLVRRVEKEKAGPPPQRAALVAFKAHLADAEVAPGACEIYFYRGGYGGLSSIEGGLSNLCFIVSARDVRASGADAERVVREVICENRRAAHTLAQARVHGEWLAVSLEGFGRRAVAPAKGLLAIGDAASFIDPFTGSGMLMALESGDLAAGVVGDYLEAPRHGANTLELESKYRARYRERFHSRLRVCSMIRSAAFVPGLAGLAIRGFAASDYLRRRVTRATRSGSPETYSLRQRLTDSR
jgi:flavin-dependent dehydrogenase